MIGFWRRKKMEKPEAEWLVFNFGSDLEFAECSACGGELEPPGYPPVCPHCGRKMEVGIRIADEPDLYLPF